MANDDSNPAIPAWQRAGRPTEQAVITAGEPKEGQPSKAPETREDEPKEIEIPTPEEPAAVAAAAELTSEGTTSTLQRQHMQTFLEDPAVKDAPMEKKRAFFESKGISKDQIDQALGFQQTTLSTNDFESFQHAQTQSASPSQQQHQQQRLTGPPIITYPEFLVEAHKPPPLITPARMINTAYVVSGVAAILYGASKFLVTPMSDSLTEARHDFAVHSQSKVDEMNERLTNLVSKVPGPTKKDLARELESMDDDDSITSDPTELYHRDMGTQTSTPPTRSSSLSSSSPATLGGKVEKPSPTDHANSVLTILHSHLDEFSTRNTQIEGANKEKMDSMNKLRSYLDGLMYTNSAYGGIWSDEGWKADGKKEDKDKAAKEDVVEELKKEIRGVKGVLLSAKRFPGVAGRAGA